MTNNTIQVSTSNTIEELRQKLNDISLSVGDSNTLVSSLSSGYSDIGSIRLADNNNFLASSNFQLNTETVFDGQNNSYNKGRIALYINDVIQEQGLDANQYYVPLQTFIINLTGNSTDWSSYIGNTVTQAASGWAGGELVYADTNTLVIYGSSSDFSLTNQISTNGAASINGARINSIEELNNEARVIRTIEELSSGEQVVLIHHNLVDSLNEIVSYIGDVSNLDPSIDDRSDLVSAINSEVVELNTAQSQLIDIIDRLGPLFTNQNYLNTSATSVSSAINELHTETTLNSAKIGTSFVDGSLSLSTDADTLSEGINEVYADIGDVSSLVTTAQTVTTAINELHLDTSTLDSEAVKLTSSSAQTIDSDLTFLAGTTVEVNGTLDVSNGTFISGAQSGEISFTNSFIELGDSTLTSPSAAGGGLKINRGSDSGATTVSITWNETDDNWQVTSLAQGGGASTAKLVDFNNAQELFANNTETGIDVTWDSNDNNFDIALDSQSVVAGTYGSSTNIPVVNVNNKGIVTSITTSSISSTLGIAGDSGTGSAIVGTDDFTISGVTNEIETSVSGSTVTIGLPDQTTVNAINATQSNIGALSVGTGAVPSSGDLVVSGDVNIVGNLDVDGAINFTDSTTVNIGDNNIVLNADVTGTPPSVTSGITINRGSSTDAQLIFDESDDKWKVNTGSGNNVDILTSSTLIDNNLNRTPATSNAEYDVTLITDSGEVNVDDGTFTYNPTISGGRLTAALFKGDLEGNADTATSLKTSRNITVNAVNHAFDGSSSIDLTESIRDTIGNMLTTGTRSGITVAHDDNNNQIDFTVSQGDSFGVVNANSGSVSASGQDQVFTLDGGTELATVASGSTITINHSNVSRTNPVASSSNGTAIVDVTTNARGHVTSVESYDFDSRYLQTSNFTLSGDVTSTSAGVATIGNDKVTFAKMQNIDANSFLANDTGSSGNVKALSVNDARSLLNISNVNSNANDYSFFISGGGTTTEIDEAETVTFNGTGDTDVSIIGNNITINSTDTTYSKSGTGLNLSGTTFSLNSNNIIGATASGNVLTLTKESGSTLNFTGGTEYGVGAGPSLNGIITGTGVNENNFGLNRERNLGASVVKTGTSLNYIAFAPSNSTITPLYLEDNNGNNTQGVVDIYTNDFHCARFKNGSTPGTDGLIVQGDVIAFSTLFASDLNLKDNVEVVTNALDKVSQLNGVEFDWKDGRGKSSGVIAQDVEKVLPQAVKETENLKGEKYKSVDYSQLTSLLIESIKELKEENKELRSMIEELKGK